MKNCIFLLLLLILAGCREVNNDSYLTPEKALEYFNSVEKACQNDSGLLWGKNLYGPLMFIDRTSRKIFANQPDSEGILKGNGKLYTGYFPKEMIINFSPVSFGGVFFAMAPLPPEEDKFRIESGAVHGLFHRYREMSGIPQISSNTNNMDEKEARIWLKLEWKALRKAIETGGEEANHYLRDALIFRGSNRELYPKFSDDQNRFENNEGLTTFTYMLFATDSKAEYRQRLFEFYDRIYSMQSYSRSYGFIEGALYATLLHEKGFDFKSINTDNFDLGDAVKKLYGITLPPVCRDVAGSIALNYNLEEITREEEQRFSDIAENIRKQISSFTERPVVFLELESPYFDFEPEDIISLDTLGTLYNSMRVSDNWGKLTVEKPGCLVASNFKYLRVSAKGFNAEKNRISGEGWHLILNEGWDLIRVDDNWFARKRMP